MNGRNHSPEQVIRRLRGAAQLAGQGQDVTAVAKAMEISEVTLHRWSGRTRQGRWRSCEVSGSAHRIHSAGRDGGGGPLPGAHREVASRAGKPAQPGDRGAAAGEENIAKRLRWVGRDPTGRSRYRGGSPLHLGPLREVLPSERGCSSSCRSASRAPKTASPVPAPFRNRSQPLPHPPRIGPSPMAWRTSSERSQPLYPLTSPR